jgi:predicted RNase H-like HicB family nuclease
MKLRVISEPSEEGGFTALIPALPGCISEGSSREEALKSIEEVAKLYLEPVEDDEDFAADAEVVELDG